ncbi:MAG: hypothetical protein J7L73_08265 [Anaerolineales bacterium]|nr:hypothetical protein [Anaerolineales bacterium]
MNDKEERSETRDDYKEYSKWQRDPVWSVVLALSLVWAGVILLMDNLGLLTNIVANIQRGLSIQFQGDFDALSFIIFGAGLILLGGFIARIFMPTYRRSGFSMGVLALLLISVGLGDLFNWNIFLALVLIMLGLWMLIRKRTHRV